MNDLIGYVIVILALVCGMAGFVSARRLSVMERDRTFEQVEIYRGGRQRRRQLQRAQTKSGSRLEAMLLSAGMAISPAMFLVGVVIAGALLGAFLHGGSGFGLVGVAGAAAAAWALLLTAAKKRSMQFETQRGASMISEACVAGQASEMSYPQSPSSCRSPYIPSCSASSRTFPMRPSRSPKLSSGLRSASKVPRRTCLRPPS